jgi:ribosomal protein L37E
MPDEEGLWCPECGSATQAELLGWCPLCGWERGRRKRKGEFSDKASQEVGIWSALTLEMEELDRVRPPGMAFPRQEPAEAVDQLPFNARRLIRLSAMYIAKWSRTGALTSPDVAPLNLLKRFVDDIHRDLQKDGVTIPYEAVDVYFRKAFQDAEDRYACEREERSRKRRRNA